MVGVLQVRDHREVDESRSRPGGQDPVDVTPGGGEDDVLRRERSVVAAGWFGVRLDDRGGGRHAPGAHPDVDRVGAQGRQDRGQTGAPHPVGEEQGVATPHQQGVGTPDRRQPGGFLDTRERGQLQDPQRSPTQSGQGRRPRAAERLPRHRRPARERVDGGGDEQGVGLGDGFAQEVRQGLPEGAVRDPVRREESSHAPAFPGRVRRRRPRRGPDPVTASPRVSDGWSAPARAVGRSRTVPPGQVSLSRRRSGTGPPPAGRGETPPGPAVRPSTEIHSCAKTRPTAGSLR